MRFDLKMLLSLYLLRYNLLKNLIWKATLKWPNQISRKILGWTSTVVACSFRFSCRLVYSWCKECQVSL